MVRLGLCENESKADYKKCVSFVRKASKLRFLIDTDQTVNLPGMLAELEPDRMLEVEREDQSYAASVLFMASW